MITVEQIDKLTEMLEQAQAHLTQAHEDFKKLLAENVDLHMQLAKLKSGGLDSDPLDEYRRRLAAWAVSHALPLIRESAKWECYVMCDCQMNARRCLEELPGETEKVDSK